MKLRPLTIRLGLALAALLTSLAFAATAGAVRPPEPGPGSPVTSQQQPRTPAAKKAKKKIRRNTGGYPINGHTHVRSPFAPDDQ